MQSTLKRQKDLNELFAGTAGIIEVYAALDHTQFTEEPTYYILLKHNIEFRAFLTRLQSMYKETVHLYCTNDPFDVMFNGTRIIWKDSKWYI